MDIEWVNNGEPDENGEITVHIKNNAGNRISTFKGKNERELLDRALNSNVESIKIINRLKRPDSGRPTTRIEPKQITEDDRERFASGIMDPEKIVETVTEIVTKQQGISPADIGRRLSADEEQAERDYINREAWAFRNVTPDYYPVPQNMDTLLAELKANGWPISRNNLQLAYQAALEKGSLVHWPSEEDKQHELTILEMNRQQPPPPAAPHETAVPPNGTTQPSTQPTRPRSIATGIRSSEANGTAPPLAPKRQKYTRADIERMSRAEFEDKLRNEQGFRQLVDTMMSPA